MGDIINRILVQVDVVWKNRYLKTFRNFLFSSHDFIALRIIATSEGVRGNGGNLGSPEILQGEWSSTQDLKKERMSPHMWVEYVYNMYFSVVFGSVIIFVWNFRFVKMQKIYKKVKT